MPEQPKTLYEKIWKRHLVREDEAGNALLYIDRHLIHEVTSPQAFDGLRQAKRALWRKESILAVEDHSIPTKNREYVENDEAREQLAALDRNCREHEIERFAMGDPRQGIVHVIGPEQGLVLPGMTVVCGDSHTSTNGALGALAFGIGTTDIEHVMVTQCLSTRQSKTMLVNVEGELRPGVYAKDIILSVIGAIGTAGATGHAIEYAGSAVRALSMEGRMTICNMSIEAGARAGMVAVDDKTIEYVKGRPYAPTGEMWGLAEAYWRTLRSDEGASFDKEFHLDAKTIKPQVSWGTSPEMVSPVDGKVPDPKAEVNPIKRTGMERALNYMGLTPGTPIQEITPDKIFIGSCTNARIEDLRAAAEILRDKHISPKVKLAMVVPGSGLVRQQAEQEGLDRVFKDAGFEWREPGCSMCLGMNDDNMGPEERCASTSNRNFEGRQGHRSRTHLVSPPMAAAAAVAGHFVDISS